MTTTAKEIPHFKGWSKIPEGYYTKTALKRDMKLKPVDESKHDATLWAVGGGKWKDFVLYHIDNTIEIKQRKVKLLDVTDKNIAEALYTINKSAKLSRDTKQSSYHNKNFQVVGASKTRQNKLYDLKDEVIKKLLNEDRMNIEGYHEQESYNGDTNYLMMLKLEGFTFHIPTSEKETAGLKSLGEIGVISAEKTRSTTINFYESEKLLNHFVNNQ
ncbi:hypothetical protein J2Z83_000095 [Virgibacillus natechei]|uniref:Uncharacterized protein n=1 Tax=Virgibacillus natechei TaxID=1216297 RepID=A0ABS4IAV6_9BACI|nr:YkyB family protein [Virgibacillus natechei]MBP1968003.1 hypothetical protein [Virgibacillus natechei]UZD14714.1 hypothetical protein OLD84_09525 [Virgibacillus natechei]